MAIALLPKTGKAWEFGIQQCSDTRVWTLDEEVQFQEIARRLTDGLTSTLIQRDLVESEAKYRRIVDTANEGILILDEHAEVVFLNAHLAKMLGYTLEELQDHRVTDFMLQEDLADHQQKLARRHKNLAETYERRLIRKDGSILWALISATPIFDGNQYRGALSMVTDITERKLAADALRHEQTLLNRIMVTSPVGIAMVNREGQITFANPQAEKILGLNKETITQLSYNAPEWHATTIDGEPMPDEAQPFSRVMAAREPVFDVQHAITWPDGRRVLLSVNGAPIFDAQNEIEAVAFAIEDITERKKAEAALQRSEQTLAESQRIAHLGSWNMDLTTNEVFWSEELYRMYGFDPSQPPPLYTESMKLFTPESWERLNSAIERATTTGEPYELELELVRKDGLTRSMLARGELVRDESGKGVMVRGVVMDITERKQAEENLRNSEHGLAEAQRIAHLGNWELDLINDSLLWSDEIFNIFEIDKEAFGASYEAFLDAIHPEDRERVNHAYTESLTDRKPYNIIHRLLMKDGRIKYVKEQCESFFDTDGKPIRSVGTVQDITEQKLREDELSRYRDHLEDEVHQRTEELRLARDAAEAANKAKSTFLANMSHELRTPLNAILGFSQMMRQATNLDELQQNNLEIINNSGKHLLKLINDVLEIAKIEAGKLQLEIAPFDLHELVREVSDMMRLRAQQKGLQLELDQSSEFPRYIKGDEARLRQILVNLLSNAVKFTEQGGVTIRLRTKNNSHHHLIIEVEDTGPGINETNQKRLFKPFVQLPEGKMQEGTGLGLAIVHQFVKLMQGDISVDSKPGQGSLFRVDIPLMEADTAEVIQLSGEHHGEVIGLVPGQPTYRILIAEDQQDNQILLTRLMTDLGLEVKVAENGKECVALFKKWKPDLIWMDRRMPVMDGVKATQQIRKLPGGEKVKIVAVTASAFREQQAELLEAGMDDFVGKPYRFDEIYISLERQLGLKLLYNDDSPEQESPALTLEPEMLDDVSDELRAALKEALETLNAERIRETIHRIGEKDRPLARLLSQLANNYDYPTILHALDPAKE
jgi:PAS domain S-box-containing protein